VERAGVSHSRDLQVVWKAHCVRNLNVDPPGTGTDEDYWCMGAIGSRFYGVE